MIQLKNTVPEPLSVLAGGSRLGLALCCFFSHYRINRSECFCLHPENPVVQERSNYFPDHMESLQKKNAFDDHILYQDSSWSISKLSFPFRSHVKEIHKTVLEPHKYTLLLLDIPYQRSSISPSCSEELTKPYILSSYNSSTKYCFNILLLLPLPTSNSSHYQKGDFFAKMKFFSNY